MGFYVSHALIVNMLPYQVHRERFLAVICHLLR